MCLCVGGGGVLVLPGLPGWTCMATLASSGQVAPHNSRPLVQARCVCVCVCVCQSRLSDLSMRVLESPRRRGFHVRPQPPTNDCVSTRTPLPLFQPPQALWQRKSFWLWLCTCGIYVCSCTRVHPSDISGENPNHGGGTKGGPKAPPGWREGVGRGLSPLGSPIL